MSARFFLTALVRESRGARGRLLFFVLCLSTGVAAVVAVAGLSSGLRDGIRVQAKQLLAADVTVEGRHPIPEALDGVVAKWPGLERMDVKELVTVVSGPARPDGEPGHSRLVELKVVEPGYPFYGALKLSPDRPLGKLLASDTAVVAPEVESRLGLGKDGRLSIGGAEFRVAGTVLSEPDRIAGAFTLGPRVFLSHEGYKRTSLGGFGSRVEHRLLLRLPGNAGPDDAARLAERLKGALAGRREGGGPSAYRVETYAEARPELRRALARVERFLGLVALLSLLIGGVGVAQSVRAWLASRLDAIAILRCLGLRPREVFGLYLGQTALLGLLGSLAGAAGGLLLLALVPRFFGGLVPHGWISPWQPVAVLRGLVMGVGVALLFSLPPLAMVRRVPPARVLRRDAEPLPQSRLSLLATALGLVGGLLATATAQARSLVFGGYFTGGLLAATAVLAVAALLLARGVGLLRSLRYWMRQGLSNLGRPGASTLGSIVALGLGVLVVLTLSIVDSHLSAQLTAELPTGAPTAFFMDVQPDQWAGVEAILKREGATNIDSVPVVMARLTKVDGRGVEEMAAQISGEGARRGRNGEGGEGGRRGERGENRRWALTREQRLTYLKELPKDNKIVEGRLWSDPAHAEVSLEVEFAKNLGAHLGSTLELDVQGVPLALKVTSLRQVDWRTFGINFFFVVEPGVLDDAPQLRLAAARLPREKEERIQDLLAQKYPNVTLIVIREILERIVSVMTRLGGAVRFLGGFAVVAGLVILAGAVSAASVRRGREAALLKTLGVTRAGVAGIFAVEYAGIGLVAGTVATAAACVTAWAVVTKAFEIPWHFPATRVAITLLGAPVLTVLAGLAASGRALSRRPLEVLRSD